ncbi:MAG: SusC/RagA family TonB-linked outer membrane protein [Bacteroidetes bacterium]|nr:SusC/RagA family TonB-linked outer membrane protein [Bacteroidota bacterium]
MKKQVFYNFKLHVLFVLWIGIFVFSGFELPASSLNNSGIQAAFPINGVVYDEEGVSLIGAAVLEKGTNNGTITDYEGKFALELKDGQATLVVSYLGYITEEVVVNNQSFLEITLKEHTEQLDEVVVTALNIERDKTSLGYAVSVLQSKEVAEVKENNIMNSLAGKVAGLDISQSAGGVDGSTRIVLRGVSSLLGDNRPLIVVDGIPINNSASVNEGEGAGYREVIDYGDALSDINPDEVESVSVLKGAGAAAAYGSRAANGAIIITTKKGRKREGIGLSLVSSFTVSNPLLFPDMQNEYGLGAYGLYSPLDSETGRPLLTYPYSWSWGPKMQGQTYTNWLGQEDTYNPTYNPFKEFYESGFSANNTIAFEGGSDRSTLRFSFTDQHSKGIVPNNDMSKQTFSFRGTADITKNITIDGKATYITSKVNNRPYMGEGSGNSALQLSLMPRSIDLDEARNNFIDERGNELKWTGDNTFNNPYWALEHLKNKDNKDRMQGLFSIRYQILENLSLKVKTGFDLGYTEFTKTGRKGSLAVSNTRGNMRNNINKYQESNSDFLFSHNTQAGDFSISTNFGGNYRLTQWRSMSQNGTKSKAPEFYHISNYQWVSTDENTSKKAVYSLYGLGTVSYKNFLYIDATVRNDWSSTLPIDNRSYLYHSENISFLFTEAFSLKNNILTKGKLRASYAQVGNDTDPYRTQLYYNLEGTTSLDYPVGSISSQLPSFDLRPESIQSYEVGTDLEFFKGGVTAEFSYFNRLTSDQIMAIPISNSTGFETKVSNAGDARTTGLELQLGVTPVYNDNVQLNFLLNVAKSNTTILSLNNGLQSIPLSSLVGITVVAALDDEFGSLYGYDYLRNALGQKLITKDGFAQRGEYKKLGNVNPDFYGGFATSVGYKGVGLRFLVSFKKGGNFYSWGRGYRMFFGTDYRTLEGRDGWYTTHDPATSYTTTLPGVEEQGYVEDGINEETGAPNTTPINPMLKNFTTYWSNQIAYDLVLDATNVRLKEVALSYQIPKKILNPKFIQKIQISAVARNLFFFYNAAGDIDPDALGFSAGNTGSALEHSSIASTRSFGVNLQLTF